MQPAAENLPAPLDTPYTPEELSKYKTPETGIYLAIKGTVFDVTRKADVYGPGKSYSVFTGKDGSRGLGMSSLKPEDAIDNIEGMDPKDEKTLNEWYAFFEKRYAIVGKVVKPDAKLES
ncbi:progesterone binding protein [Cylindrobasidium torrendii FP15055 ss-10]|uniref:Progesterone binding protein n=1 Tax=Cylindrobasidium torrendii FP15055 ss-10 TaxID=1314674 RepID=A0A0D7BMA7_9AGAR|nr:progesterone binding protein [Cylindrobasidium torrendii FP15055 ss-10]